jgi:hypothetical protein
MAAARKRRFRTEESVVPTRTARLRRPLLCAASLLALGLTQACDGDDDTQLVAVVNSNYRPGVELASVKARVGTRSAEWRVIDADDAGAGRGSGGGDGGLPQTGLPFSFGVSPPHGDAGAKVDITVEGFDPEHALLVRRRVRVGFVEHAIKRLDVELLQSCAAMYSRCEDVGKTCIAGDCDAVDVNAARLPSVRPGSELDGVHPLDWWCDQGACSDADAAQDAGDGSTATTDSGPDPRDADSGRTDSGPAADAGAGDSGDTGTDSGTTHQPQFCGPGGLFRYVGRTLAGTRDSKLCAFLAEDTYYDPDAPTATLEDNARGVDDYITAALTAEADVIHLDVAQVGSDVQVTGRDHATTLFPSLQSVLEQALLRDADQPVKLEVAEGTVTDSSQFATALLDVLLAVQPDVLGESATGYARDCRPVFLVSTDAASFDALVQARDLIMTDGQYASLRGYLQFGRHIGDQRVDYAMLIDQAEAVGFELIEPEISTPNLKAVIDYATREKDLDVVIADVRFDWLAPLLCGAATGASVRGGLALTRMSIAQSRRMVDLDLGPAPSDNWVDYRGGDDNQRIAQLGDGLGNGSLPKQVTAGPGESLRGNFLMFDGSKGQSVALFDADDSTAQTESIALGVVVRFHSLPSVDGERHVIVSKRQGSSGWAIELARASGVTVLQIRAFVNDGQGVQEVLVPFQPTALNTDDSYYIYAAFTGYYTGIGLGEPDPSASLPPVDHGSPFALVENSAPVTLGADPGAITDTFDGDLQLFRLMTF